MTKIAGKVQSEKVYWMVSLKGEEKFVLAFAQTAFEAWKVGLKKIKGSPAFADCDCVLVNKERR